VALLVSTAFFHPILPCPVFFFFLLFGPPPPRPR